MSIEEEILGADAIEHDIDDSGNQPSSKSKVAKSNVIEPIEFDHAISAHCASQDSSSQDKEPSDIEDEAEMDIENELARRSIENECITRSRKVSKPNVSIIVTAPSRHSNYQF